MLSTGFTGTIYWFHLSESFMLLQFLCFQEVEVSQFVLNVDENPHKETQMLLLNIFFSFPADIKIWKANLDKDKKAR